MVCDNRNALPSIDLRQHDLQQLVKHLGIWSRVDAAVERNVERCCLRPCYCEPRPRPRLPRRQIYARPEGIERAGQLRGMAVLNEGEERMIEIAKLRSRFHHEEERRHEV